MKRRTLDILTSAGGVVFAVLLFLLGLVLADQASFAEDYVEEQLAEQKIVFAQEVDLDGEQDADGGECLVEYAGEPLESGKQAECYANQYIAYQLRAAAVALAAETGREDYDAATYSRLGNIARSLQAGIDDMAEMGDDTTAVEEQLSKATELRALMFEGETLRGLLLTTYGFSIFGERAQTAATVCFIAAALILLLSIAGFVHAAMTSREERALSA